MSSTSVTSQKEDGQTGGITLPIIEEKGKKGYTVVNEEMIDGVKVLVIEKKSSRKVYYEKNKEAICKKKSEWQKSRYMNDEEFRERQKAISRENYRKKMERLKSEKVNSD